MEAALASEFGVDPTSAQVSFSGRTDRAIGRDLFHLHGLEGFAENWNRFLSAYLHNLPGCLARHRGRVLPGISAFLEQLAARPDLVVGLLTGNVRDGARLKLGHYGLAHHFALGGYGDHHWERDDVAREALAAVCEHLNGSADLEQIWVIGDTPLDVQCARCIGVRVAAVATGWHSLEELTAVSPDLALADLSDPAPLLALWED
jgi:phosphoglycolate phosphatase-like HAD superfamily hydrolase